MDDINFTHADRKFVGSLAQPTAKEKADAAQGTEEETGDSIVSEEVAANQQDPAAETENAMVPLEFDKNFDGVDDRIFGFPNGTGVEDGFTLKGNKAYEELVNVAIAYDQFHRQHVPRFTKRPGDLALQGSNNTLIVLGEQRGWGRNISDGTTLHAAFDAEYSNATFDEGEINNRKDFPWGCIDMVAGRGRHDWRMRDKNEQLPPVMTAPRCIFNSPGEPPMVSGHREKWVEVNKNPQAVEKAEFNRLDALPEFGLAILGHLTIFLI